MNAEKELFDIILTKKTHFEIFQAVKELLKNQEYYIKGKQNAEFHKDLTTIQVNMEKGGNEEKLAIMTYINRLKSDISLVYSEFIC